MSGRTVLVTGGSSGIGEWTAIGLARRGAQVVITSRSQQRADEAIERIRDEVPSAALEAMTLDLADLTDVHRFADAFGARHERLDVLVNNAGLTLSERRETVDGHEMLFQTNHLAPFLLTDLLLDRIRAAAPARIVTVASAAHRSARGIDFDDLDSEHRPFVGLVEYARTKLMNVLFVRELARRLEGSGVTSNALHPGTVRTGWGSDTTGLLRIGLWLARPFFKTPEQGARTSVFVAGAPQLEGRTGRYYKGRREVKPSRVARDDDLARKLWEVSAELVGRPS
ncbi:MAG: SDR family oxidoreductase [Actinobacteria bacterium]|nr:SDR family oxidoreductase [Actinomycetota bacterium]